MGLSKAEFTYWWQISDLTPVKGVSSNDLPTHVIQTVS